MIAGTFLLQAGQGEASIILMLHFKQPRQQNAQAFKDITSKTIYCYNPVDTLETGYSYIMISGNELKDIFGLELRTHIISGAGNRLDSDYISLEILNKEDLNPQLKPLLRDFNIQNDAKFLLYDKASPDSCVLYFRPSY